MTTKSITIEEAKFALAASFDRLQHSFSGWSHNSAVPRTYAERIAFAQNLLDVARKDVAGAHTHIGRSSQDVLALEHARLERELAPVLNQVA